MNHLEVIRAFLNPETFTELSPYLLHKNYHIALKRMQNSDEWLKDSQLVKSVMERLDTINLLDKALIGEVSDIYRKIYQKMKKEKKSFQTEEIFLRHSEPMNHSYSFPRRKLMAESYFFLHFFSDSNNLIYDFSEDNHQHFQMFIHYLIYKKEIEREHALEMLSFAVKYAIPNLFLMSLKHLLNPDYSLAPLKDCKLAKLVNDLRDQCVVSFSRNQPYLEINVEDENAWYYLDVLNQIIPLDKIKMIGCEDFVRLSNFLVDHPSLSDVRLIKSPLINDAQLEELSKLNTTERPLFIKKEKSVVERFLHRLNISLKGSTFEQSLELAYRILVEDLSHVQDFSQIEEKVIFDYLNRIDYTPRFLMDDLSIIFLKKKKFSYPRDSSLDFERRHIRVYRLSSELLGKGQTAFIYKLKDLTVRQESASLSVEDPPKYKALKVFKKKTDNVEESGVKYQKIMEGTKKEGIISSWFPVARNRYPYLSVLTPCYEASLEKVVPEMRKNPKLMLDVLLKLLKGLSAIHQKGCCHLDVKQDNILIKRKRITPDTYRTDVVIADLDTLADEKTPIEVFTRHSPMYLLYELGLRRFQLIAKIKAKAKKQALRKRKLVELGQSTDLSALGLTFLMIVTNTPIIDWDPSKALYKIKKIEEMNIFSVSNEFTDLGKQKMESFKKNFFLVDLLLQMIDRREKTKNIDYFIRKIGQHQRNFSRKMAEVGNS